ncbi:MAG: hypothetical protein CVV64_05610 [Candidatus Wallbacteria bacterium HGW-Wallbacteria-1]|jgi:hypothetical protein|uniref:Uncharacterized protein n=1 Tax=Candidatus Wallbacteria bacterium HGW-Wallbacteria-1 TaxID=2013854 RepID=A0A2N1PSD4_9BACT|nr:MAG: hypothetical protein CVV64_05610 [Candidatus Wallbacteria bacterium HGW-Wallbacteria-1]
MAETHMDEVAAKSENCLLSENAMVLAHGFPRIEMEFDSADNFYSESAILIVAIDKSFSLDYRKIPFRQLSIGWEPYLVGKTLVLKAENFSLRVEGVDESRAVLIDIFFQNAEERFGKRGAIKSGSTENKTGKTGKDASRTSSKSRRKVLKEEKNALVSTKVEHGHCSRCGSNFDSGEFVCLICGAAVDDSALKNGTFRDNSEKKDEKSSHWLLYMLCFYLLWTFLNSFSSPVQEKKSDRSDRISGKRNVKSRKKVQNPLSKINPVSKFRAESGPVASKGEDSGPAKRKTVSRELADEYLKAEKFTAAAEAYACLLRKCENPDSGKPDEKHVEEAQKVRLLLSEALVNSGDLAGARVVLLEAYKRYFHDDDYRKEVLKRLSGIMK